jgi:hypothetical protein
MSAQNNTAGNLIGRAVATPVHSDALDALREVIGSKALFSISETSEICDRLKPWLYRQMASGRIRYIWLGPRRAITRSEILRIASEGVSSDFPSSKSEETAA